MALLSDALKKDDSKGEQGVHHHAITNCFACVP
jgi:hypothetical protein